MAEIIALVLIGFLISRLMAWGIRLKRDVLSLGANYRKKFYDTAYELIETGELSPAQLRRLSAMSELMTQRTSQFFVINALNETQKDYREGLSFDADEPSISSGLPEKLADMWSSMRFYWLVAVCAKGSIIGTGAILKLVETLDPNKSARPQAEGAVSRILNQNAVAAH